MKKLIVNADDFGLTDGVCRGIVEAINQGLVSSCTAMVCMAGALERITNWAPQIAGKIGLHLQLTGDCEPCLPPEQIPSLVTSTGRFPRRPEDVTADPLEAAKEWRAQLARLRGLGVEPNHLDSHHHIHQRPELFPVYADLAAELGLPVRYLKSSPANVLEGRGVKHPAACVTDWFGANTDLGGLLACLEAIYTEADGDKPVELMCHPGYSGQDLNDISTYAEHREAELGVLTSQETAGVLAKMEIQIIDWSDLA
jgi:predicted glycoside hydrolase/deacetylase ChbG (UPF0249 family)